MDQHAGSAVRSCPHAPRLDSAHSRLGALYFAEGPALWGRDLPRSLDRPFGEEMAESWLFFIGHGPETGEAWRGWLAQFSAARSEPSARVAIINGAVETVAAFEHWLDGWSTLSHG